MVFLPPLPEVGCPIFLEIRNPWGKVVERSGLTFEHFLLWVRHFPRKMEEDDQNTNTLRNFSSYKIKI